MESIEMVTTHRLNSDDIQITTGCSIQQRILLTRHLFRKVDRWNSHQVDYNLLLHSLYLSPCGQIVVNQHSSVCPELINCWIVITSPSMPLSGEIVLEWILTKHQSLAIIQARAR